MKNLLLALAVAFGATATVWADEVDITPSAYDYNTVTSFSYGGTSTGANITAPVWTTVDGDNTYNNGLVWVAGGQFASSSTTYYADLQTGTTLVDLGGTVGQVLAISGMSSTVNTALYNNYGVNLDLPLAGGGLNWFNIDWFSDPNNTPSGDTNVIHVRLTLNIYSNSPSEDYLVNTSYPMDNQNNVQPSGSGSNTAEGCGISTLSFCKWYGEDTGTYEEEDYDYDDDGNLIWNPERWMVYEFDCTMPESDDDGTAYIPFRVKTEFNATTLQTSTIFIKSVEITYEAGGTVSYASTRNRQWVYYTLSPSESGITSVTNDSNEVLYNVNGQNVTFVKDAQVYTTSGALVGTAQTGETITLGKGFYVANVGGKGVKFVVK